MPSIRDHRNRILLPRWRDVYNPASTIILSTEQKKEVSSDEEFAKKKEDFKEVKNFGNALEVVNASFSMGMENDAIEEANFIISLQQYLPSGLFTILQRILGDRTKNPQKFEQNTDPLLQNIFKESGKKISELRKRLRKFYFNPLLWLELARLYSILGYRNKAEAAAQIALQLSKNSNRLITRSVSRFYLHNDDPQKAQWIVRNSPNFKNDPWLVSCDIGYSQFMKRRAASIKTGLNMIEGRSFTKSDLTELAAVIGTEKQLTGSDKTAKKNFSFSLESPNENSFAQVEFFYKELAGQSKMIDKIPGNFEAMALEDYTHRKFTESYNHAFQWLVDQPFSRRAAFFASYLLCGVLENHEKAIEIGKFSLHSNPDSFLLHNNIAFSYISLGNLSDARRYIKNAKNTISDAHEKIIIAATEGMLLYREGSALNDEMRISKGRELYKEAISDTGRQGNKELQILVSINFIREEYLCGSMTKANVNTFLQAIPKKFYTLDEIARSVDKLKNIIEK